MNRFRSFFNSNTDLEDKLASYEQHVTSLESELTAQSAKIEELFNQVQTLLNSNKEQEEVIELAEQVLVETEQKLAEVQVELEAKEEVIQEVIENTMTVEKQAAHKAALILGEMGTPVVETIDAPEEIDIVAQMKQLHGKELINFYNQHKPSYQNMLNKAIKK